MRHLFLGGARRGKSRLAEEASLACDARICLHQEQRDQRW